jgi:hypothetical protein
MEIVYKQVEFMKRAKGELERKLLGYAEFLRKRQLAPPKHQPHLVRWVRQFLVFATEHRGYTFEQTLDKFLAAACATTQEARKRHICIGRDRSVSRRVSHEAKLIRTGPPTWFLPRFRPRARFAS